MSPDPKDWKFPILGGVISRDSNFHIEAIRELSEEEQKKIAEYTKKAAHARNRFKLFTILGRNYEQWWTYTRSLLTPGGELLEDEMLELDRLLLNFQSSAKSVIDHFRQDWIKKYRGTPEESQFQEFLQKLEDASWAFAFFQDLRNFTQHCGLPVGNYTRKADVNSVTLKVEADAKWLIDHYKKWDKSKLKETDGCIDLMGLTREYFLQMHSQFGKFVANAFAPDLVEAHNFFAALSTEVTTQFPNAEFKIITEFELIGDKMNFQFKTPPADLLRGVGISILESPPAQPR